MARILKPLVRGGGWYPSNKWIPLVKNGGYTTQNGGGDQPEPPTPEVWKTASGAIVSFVTSVAYPMRSLVAQINPVQAGTGDPSPDNIRPITGHTGLSVEVRGKNLLNLVESEMVSSGWNRAFPISVKAGTYIISCQNQFGASSALGANVYFRDENDADIKTLAGNYTFGNSSFVGTATTITEDEAEKIKYITFGLRAGGTTYSNIVVGKIQLEVGSSASSYEPYTSGTTTTVSWQDTAGTVYGGTLDVVSGLLTVTDAEIASYNGETLPSTWISDRDVYDAGTTPTIGAQVVYKLATPQSFAHEGQSVDTLVGQNNVWVTSGDVEVTYRIE